jgi:hypothetical protein
MSSMPLRNSNLQAKEIIQESVSQMYPGAWQSETGQKEDFVFPCIRADGARCKILWNRRRTWSSLN